MARITIVDENDEIIGYKERSALAPDDIYRVAALWVTNSRGNILLAQRKLTKKHNPGKWGPAVAGTVEEGETYDSNVIKEAEEEIGLTDIKPTKGPKIRVRSPYHFFDQWYTLTIDKPAEQFIIQEDEVEQVQWFTPDELRQGVAAHPDNYLTELDSLIDIL